MRVTTSVKSINKISLTLVATLALSGCAFNQYKTPSQYSAADFVAPNRIVAERIPVHLPEPKVAATFGVGNNPKVIKAYEKFSKTGVAESIEAEGFKTFAYNAYAHPVLACAPMKLCVLELERNEAINNIELGDSAHWLVATARIGSKVDGSYQVVIKPKRGNIATDMVITTDKRTYNIGLVSELGAQTYVMNFYYPEETLNQTLKGLRKSEEQSLQTPIISQSTHIDVNQMNFDYAIAGDYPSWRPKRAFDDGSKSFIEMPASSSQTDLPVLYLVKNDKLELVNYRYRAPYFVIDGLFKEAFLLSGKGHEQVKVSITNNRLS